MSPGYIRVAGARENNLADVSVEIPVNRITVFVGVSGSGKSSLVFDTIAVEAQRQLNATYPWSVRSQLPAYERPHVDAVENLTAPVVVDQRPLGGNARSTVGTITDVYSVLRGLYARFGDPVLGRPGRFSFNDPEGMCPECDGLGRTLRPDPDLMLDRSKSLAEGAILVPGYPVGSPGWQFYTNYPGLNASKKLSRYSGEEMETLLHGSEGHTELKFKNGRTQRVRYEGLVANFTRRNLKRDVGTLSEKTRAAAERFIAEGPCPSCAGARLNAEALAVRLDGHTIADLAAMQVSDLLEALRSMRSVPAELLEPVRAALERIDGIGLGYLTLDRATASLSGGEAQRLKLVNHLGSDLRGLTYVFDEPSVGLHPHDVGRLTGLLRALRDKGNTVLVVEHDPDVVAVADHVVELGPGAGSHGGHVEFTGTVARLRKARTVTGAALRRRAAVNGTPRRHTGTLPVRNASLHNLRDVSVDFPAGVLTVVTGVAGAGKSSLVGGVFRQAYPDAVWVDQSPIAASSRSTPATYLGLWDGVRKLFAKSTGADAGLFSFNSAGACEACQGKGVLITEIAFLDPVTTHCDRCDGRRFTDAVLEHRVRGTTIADVLAMTAEQAVEFFTERPIRTRLQALLDTGLGYLGLGQSLSTLSGGERQRLKLADQLAATGSVYLLDEPTSGLHPADTGTLLALLDGMVDRGNTVIVIEHDPAVIAHADWVVDLGPEGGHRGGRVQFTGTPDKLARAENSLTGEHLRRYLGE
ncbi:excinuclease ABC subunit UvrA [Amycolatopsis suaedae]|uniref:UvrABC system protein A n=1 Tax=Amycolatopsis suaedae TaxID=2510978 RepID=A0A4V2ELE6_9PSEU|nr:excinuclease ABC subunit UvrA [Amycolatopsis suaedae]